MLEARLPAEDTQAGRAMRWMAEIDRRRAVRGQLRIITIEGDLRLWAVEASLARDSSPSSLVQLDQAG